ncbi:MAG: deoxyribodipyrimidine photolyase, partial [Vallitaleaceae bacterium]|nr:deoxyribodipyrimidine photolyase [Vallitaleaceae bacterium]
QLALQHELTWEHEGLVAFTPEIKDKIDKELQLRKIRVIQDELKQRESLLYLLATLAIDHSVKGSPCFQGGYLAAKKRLEDFVLNKLAVYDQSGSPEFDLSSKLSAYLHFGQISSMEIYRRVTQAYQEQSLSEESVQGFLEQLLVRRELAFNYVYYRVNYDSFEHMTNKWAYQTMKDHEADVREYQYSLEDFEQAKTHDIYWNAAMMEGIRTGHMHNYMRMYWCKKIIEWTVSYQEAYKIAIYLNNRYFLDGRDANSYTGIAWCFGLHDRGWTEREIFGKLRYMNEKGLKRKFNMEAYLERVRKEEGCQLT